MRLSFTPMCLLVFLFISSNSAYPRQKKSPHHGTQGGKSAGEKNPDAWNPVENGESENGDTGGIGHEDISDNFYKEHVKAHQPYLKSGITELLEKWDYKLEDIPEPFGQMDPKKPLRNPKKQLLSILKLILQNSPPDVAGPLKALLDNIHLNQERVASEKTKAKEDNNGANNDNTLDTHDSSKDQEDDEATGHQGEAEEVINPNYESMCPDDKMTKIESKLDLLLSESNQSTGKDENSSQDLSENKIGKLHEILRELENGTESQLNLEHLMEQLTNLKSDKTDSQSKHFNQGPEKSVHEYNQGAHAEKQSTSNENPTHKLAKMKKLRYRQYN